MTTVFDRVLTAEQCRLVLEGDPHELSVRRWRGEPDDTDELMLDRCCGPTLDVGCGPGRMTRALLARGATALGIDTSLTAIRLTVERGGLALRRSVFDRVPGEGSWRHVLLADGNLGIGGDPLTLLCRVGELLAPEGSAMVELHPPGTGLRSGRAQIDDGPWFPWSRVGVDAIEALAASASLRVGWTANRDERWLVELVRTGGELR